MLQISKKRCGCKGTFDQKSRIVITAVSHIIMAYVFVICMYLRILVSKYISISVHIIVSLNRNTAGRHKWSRNCLPLWSTWDHTPRF